MKRIILLSVLHLLLVASGDTARTRSTARARQLSFAHQPKEVETVWDNIDIQKVDEENSPEDKGIVRARGSVNDDEVLARQYPGFPGAGGGSGGGGAGGGEVPRPIQPPVQPPAPSPSPAPGCHALRGQFPSEKSCANYLNCWDETVIEQTCPNGLLFNDVAGFCDFDYNVNCGSRPGPTPKPGLPSESKYCPDLNGRYRSSTNCSEFYICLVGKPIKFNCPRGLVYNDELGVCDYPANVDCQGAATPKPEPPTTTPATVEGSTYVPTYPASSEQPPATQRPTSPPHRPTHRPTYPTHRPTNPTHRPTNPTHRPTNPTHRPTSPTHRPTNPTHHPTNPPSRPTTSPQRPTTSVTQRPTSQPPTYPSQPSFPGYPPQQPGYPPQQPGYPPQQPGYPPQQPGYPPQQPGYPSQQPSYPPQQPTYNPWLSQDDPDPWHQRPVASRVEIEATREDPEGTSNSPAALQDEEPVSPAVVNPWDSEVSIPAELTKAPCNDGDIHRLDDSCANVVVCRQGRPELVRCPLGLVYDKPSDSCKPFSVAKC